jgi:hypothetical protein
VLLRGVAHHWHSAYSVHLMRGRHGDSSTARRHSVAVRIDVCHMGSTRMRAHMRRYKHVLRV